MWFSLLVKQTTLLIGAVDSWVADCGITLPTIRSSELEHRPAKLYYAQISVASTAHIPSSLPWTARCAPDRSLMASLGFADSSKNICSSACRQPSQLHNTRLTQSFPCPARLSNFFLRGCEYTRMVPTHPPKFLFLLQLSSPTATRSFSIPTSAHSCSSKQSPTTRSAKRLTPSVW